jgi:hypothetical protein
MDATAVTGGWSTIFLRIAQDRVVGRARDVVEMESGANRNGRCLGETARPRCPAWWWSTGGDGLPPKGVAW